MTIREMHILFRQLGQQMGMQTIRALTSEQIDVLLNSSIADVLSEVVRNNITKTADTSVKMGYTYGNSQDNYKLGPINSLGSLYRRQEIDLAPPVPDASSDKRIFQFISSKGMNKMTTEFYRYVPSTSTVVDIIADYFYIVGFKLIYDKPASGVSGFNGLEDTASAVSYVRPSLQGIGRSVSVDILDENKLFESLQDEYLKPSVKHPCIVMFNNKQFELYMGDFKMNSTNTFRLKHSILPRTLIMSYIGKPVKVHLAETVTPTDVDVDSDMPIHLHELIVKHAVDLYIKTLSKVPFATTTQTTNTNQ